MDQLVEMIADGRLAMVVIVVVLIIVTAIVETKLQRWLQSRK